MRLYGYESRANVGLGDPVGVAEAGALGHVRGVEAPKLIDDNGDGASRNGVRSVRHDDARNAHDGAARQGGVGRDHCSDRGHGVEPASSGIRRASQRLLECSEHLVAGDA